MLRHVLLIVVHAGVVVRRGTCVVMHLVMSTTDQG
jgi:hypothetical protein